MNMRLAQYFRRTAVIYPTVLAILLFFQHSTWGAALPATTLRAAEAQVDALQSLPLSVLEQQSAVGRVALLERQLRRYVAAKSPGSASILGRLLLWEGRFREAEALLEAHGLADEAAQASRRLEVAKRILVQFPPGYRALRVEPFENAWAVLTARVSGGLMSTWKEYRDVRLSVIEHDGNTIRWQAAVQDTRNMPTENQIGFYVADLTEDGHPNLVVTLGLTGGISIPSYVQIHGDSARPLLCLTSATPVWFEQRDGRWYVLRTCAVGTSLGRTDTIRWTDIYGCASSGEGFTQLDARFPNDYLTTEQKLRRALGRHPDNWQLLEYLALTQEIRQQPQRAVYLYQRAIEQAQKYMETLSLTARESTEREVQEMRMRISSLNGH